MNEDKIDRSLACDLVGDMKITAPRVPRFGNHRAASFSPSTLRTHRSGSNRHTGRGYVVAADVRFGSQADICVATSHVRFTVNSDRKSGLRQTVMSALPLKADMCGAKSDVR